ncbi:MAG: 2-oxoacid:acceptor oxidoreductase subunit alpha [Candidatus Mcinerneyibacterium aminivorans]|uniref:2-oxoacid:acceptor oxidoreductase subunit alpha n=1 Tax=Candidatus Mcinerneyibacterium aminivorans TaxID=2703815 RepID=A0A5D0ML46_9BACT|nr:MAG: 2-oxoacid:acceptor oxidoreductase subunit alpha [Candidatus Mcinerneyibacterium aminivorans]
MEKVKFLEGNTACALGAVRAGLKFFGGYPITPSSEVAEVCSEELPKAGGRFIQMEDEIASIASIIGASLAGSKAMTATSGPGFSLMQEALGMAVMGEVPIVIVSVMRGGPSTGHPTGPSQGDLMQARWGTHGDHPIIAIYPESVNEVYYEIIRAFNLAEKYRQPVVFLMDEVLGHMKESVFINEDKIETVERRKIEMDQKKYNPFLTENDIPLTANYGEGYRFHVTGLYHDETGFPDVSSENIQKTMDRMYRKIYNNMDDISKNEEMNTEDMDILLFSVGTQARSAKMAIRMLKEEGINAGLFRPITLWPFPEERIVELGKKVSKIVAIEMNKGQMADELRKYVCEEDEKKIIPLNKLESELIPPQEIVDKVKEVL